MCPSICPTSWNCNVDHGHQKMHIVLICLLMSMYVGREFCGCVQISRKGRLWMDAQTHYIYMAGFPRLFFSLKISSTLFNNIHPCVKTLIQLKSFFHVYIYILFNLGSMLGAHIQTIPGHFDPFSSIICDMGSNKFQWVLLFPQIFYVVSIMSIPNQ
jgi:hypothetical protein